MVSHDDDAPFADPAEISATTTHDDLAQLTAAVAALTETVRVMRVSSEAIQRAYAVSIGRLSTRIDDIERVIRNEVALSTDHTQRLDSVAGRVAKLNTRHDLEDAIHIKSEQQRRDAEYIAELDAMDKARQMAGGER